jgi:hypothetical protein
MGRPLHKDVNGVRVTRSFTQTGADNQAGIRVQGYFGSLASDYQIVKQRGKSTFVVLKTSTDELTDIESLNTIGNNAKVGTLVSGTPAAEGEIRIQGYTSSNSGTLVSVAKLTRRLAYDFSGNRYTWYLDNDSSNDYIVLTAV